MLTDQDARALSKIMAEPDMFPEARKEISRALLSCYKDLLSSRKSSPVPTVRRMWQ